VEEGRKKREREEEDDFGDFLGGGKSATLLIQLENLFPFSLDRKKEEKKILLFSKKVLLSLFSLFLPHTTAAMVS